MSKLLWRAGLLAALMFSIVGASGCVDDVNCASNDDCSGDTPICSAEGECVPNIFVPDEDLCDVDSDCDAGNICRAGLCEAGCRTSAGCADGEACVMEACVAVGDACEAASECPAGLDCIDNKCLECEANSQCSGGAVCVDNACQECTSNSQCSGSQVCVEGACTTVPLQCSNVGEACVEGAPTRRGFSCAKFEDDDRFYCYNACQPREFCSGGFLNDPDPTGACNSNDDCGPGQRCATGLSGSTCSALPACMSDGDCASVPDTSCAGGFCSFNCSSDADCSGGAICDGDSSTCRACANDGECANGFFCNDGSCIGEAYLYFSGEACSLGEICDADATGQRACRRSECEGPIAGQTTCDAIAAANPDAYPNGAICAPRRAFKKIRLPRGQDDPETTSFDEEGQFRQFIQEGFFCEAAGLQQEGDPCGIANVNSREPYPQCATGLTCSPEIEGINLDSQFEFWDIEFNLIIEGQTNVRGICQRPCSRDEQCGVGESCIGEDFGQANGLGFCGVRCEPFTLLDDDACPEGTSCRAISSEDGWCGDLTLTVTQAMQNQDVPFIPPAGDSFAGGPCPNGDEDCPHGTRCLNLGEPRCLQQCDPTLQNQNVRDAACQGGNPGAYVKFIHLAQGAPDVDIYVDGVRVADDVAFESLVDVNGDWFGIDAGEHDVAIVLGTEEDARRPLLALDIVSEGNTATYFVVVPDPNNADGIRVLPFLDERVAPTPEEGNAALRIAHAVAGAGNVDVVAVAADGDVSDQAQQIVLTEGFAEGTVTGYLAVPEGTYDVYIFTAGGTRTELDAAAVLSDVAVTAGAQGTFYAFGAIGAQPRTPGGFLANHDRFVYVPIAEGYCYDLNQGTSGATVPSSGICLPSCNSAIDWIDSPCENPDTDACDEFGDDLGLCISRTGTGTTGNCETTADCAAGEACNSEGQCVEFCEPGTECCTSTDQCPLGTFCDEKGTNADGEVQAGVCRSYCSTNGDARFPTCGDGESCIPFQDIEGLGECRIACERDEPGTFTDSSCPQFQQTCAPYAESRISYCQPSGAVALDGDCQGDDGGTRLCTPGSICARDIRYNSNGGFTPLLDAFVNDNLYEGESCRELCRPFLPFGQNDCREGYACSPIMPAQNPTTYAGVCQPAIDLSQDSSPEDCAGADIGKMCGNAAYCTTADFIEKPEEGICEATGSCLYLCDPATNTGCPPDKECQGLGSVDFPSFFIGAYGICRDR